MSIEELLKLRDEVGRALSQKAVQLEQQLARLGGEVRTERRGRGGSDMLRARARYGVLVVGEEMKGLVNCNFLPGSARRLELGTVSAEPLSRAYWSQNSGRSAKRLACRACVLLAKVPIALKRAVGLSGPSTGSAPPPTTR